MGKPSRAGESDAQGDELARRDSALAGRITAPGRIEGGDVVWLDERTLAVGLGTRTNVDGIRQLTKLLGNSVDSVITVPLPDWRGPQDVMHLMSLLSPIDS